MINIIQSYIEEKAFLKASKDIKEKLAKGEIKKIFFIVPEQFTLEAEKMLTNKLTIKGLMEIEVVSIKRLSNRIIEKTKRITSPVLKDSGKSMVLSYILSIIKDDLICFRNLVNKVSFNENICSLFDEMKKNNVTSEDLNPDRFKDITKDDFVYKKAKDIEYIYKMYNSYLEDNYVDDNELTTLASSLLEKAEFLQESEIYYFGFEGFDKNVYELIEGFININLNQTFLFTNKPKNSESEAYFLIDNTINKIVSICKNNNEEISFFNTEEREAKEDLAFLCDNIFSYSNAKFAKEVKNIQLFKATSIEEEVENVALNIIKLIKEEDALYKQILVLPSDYELYSDTIKDIFTKHKINFFLDNTTNIIDTNIIRGIIKILNIITDNFKTRDIISFFKTRLTPLSKEEIEIFENYALEFDIKGSMWTKEFTRNNYNNEYNLEILNERKNEALSPIIDLSKKLKNENDPKIITETFYEFICSYGIQSKVENIVKEFKAKEDYTGANKYAQIYNTLISLLDQIYSFLGDKKLTLEEYTKSLEAGFKSVKIGIIPSTIDSVNIATLSRSRSNDISYLFILGLNDGKLPSNFVNSSGIFSDKEKLILIDNDVNIRTTVSYKEEEERYFLNTLLLKAKEKIFLSYPISNEKGDELLPSSLIMKIKSIMPSIKETTYNFSSIKDNIFVLSNYDASFNHLLENKINKNNNEEVSLFWEEVSKKYEEDNNGKHLLRTINKAVNFDNKADITNKKIYNEIIKADKALSITKLETYAKCPFNYFIKYIINPKERSKAQIRSLDTGSLLHEIINDFSRRVINNDIDIQNISNEELAKKTVEITNEHINKYDLGKFKQVVNSKYFRYNIIKSAIYSTNFIKEDLNSSNFKLTGTEEIFNGNSSVPLNILTKDNNVLTIEGKIDRVDSFLNSEGNEYIKVVDYKSSSTSFDFLKNYYGTSLQLPIYMAAMTNEENKNPAGALYFNIKPNFVEVKAEDHLDQIAKKIEASSKLEGIILADEEIACNLTNYENSKIKSVTNTSKNEIKLKAGAITENEFNALIKHSKDISSKLYDDMIKGNIEIHPIKLKSGEENGCQYCDKKGICNFDTCFKGNNYNSPRVLTDKQIIELLKEKYKEEES